MGVAPMIMAYVVWRRTAGRRFPEDDDRATYADDAGDELGHFSAGSLWPFVMAGGVLLALQGFIYGVWLLVLGAADLRLGHDRPDAGEPRLAVSLLALFGSEALCEVLDGGSVAGGTRQPTIAGDQRRLKRFPPMQRSAASYAVSETRSSRILPTNCVCG